MTRRLAMAARRWRRDDAAATAIMEDLPAFLVITIAVGIFMLTAVSALGAFKGGYDTVADYEEAYAYAVQVRADDAFLVPFASHPGQFSYDEILALQIVADESPASARQQLGVPQHVRVRVLDVNTATCAPLPCEIFRFDNDVPDTGGSVVAFHMPVTIQYGLAEVHGGVLEVATWKQ